MHMRALTARTARPATHSSWQSTCHDKPSDIMRQEVRQSDEEVHTVQHFVYSQDCRVHPLLDAEWQGNVIGEQHNVLSDTQLLRSAYLCRGTRNTIFVLQAIHVYISSKKMVHT